MKVVDSDIIVKYTVLHLAEDKPSCGYSQVLIDNQIFNTVPMSPPNPRFIAIDGVVDAQGKDIQLI